MAIEKGLLTFAGITTDKMFAGVLGTQTEKLNLRGLTADDGHRRAPVNFSLPANIRLQGNEGLGYLHS